MNQKSFRNNYLNMEKNILYKNISKYIFDQDHVNPNEYDFTNFSITDFDYRTLFEGNNFVTNKELCLKFFGPVHKLDLNDIYGEFCSYITHNQEKWRTAFIFFMTLPYTAYEFVGENGDIIDPDNLDKATDSQASDNILLGTFSKIDFIDNREMPQKRFDNTLKRILDTDIFSKGLYTTEQTKNIILLLLRLRFTQEHKYTKKLKKQSELTFRDLFKNFLFEPICNFVAVLQNIEIYISDRNNVGPTGVETKVPHQTNDIFHSYPDLCAYLEENANNTLAIVEVKKFIHNNKLNFTNPLTNSFLLQLLAEMFTNRKNKGILTDSNWVILTEIDFKRTLDLKAKREKEESQTNKRSKNSNTLTKKRKLNNYESISITIDQKEDENSEIPKKVALNYKVVSLHSSKITIMGALTSFLYEAFEGNDYAKESNTLFEIYQYIRKTDKEYLTYLTEEYKKILPNYSRHCCKGTSMILRKEKIQLGEFYSIDIQSGFNFISQIFKVNHSDVEEYMINDTFDKSNEIIVKVFDAYKFKRIHKTTDLKKNRMTTCSDAYALERKTYETLSQEKRFNNLYLEHKEVFSEFYIHKYYHAMGPYIIFQYLELDLNLTYRSEDERLAIYKLAQFQLRLIHSMDILHSDILETNIMYSSKDKKVFLIDFGYSKYDGKKKESRPIKASPEGIKEEHIQLCNIFKVAEPTMEEFSQLMRPVKHDEVC